MKLSIRGLTLSLAIVWGVVVLLCAIANLVWPPYADVFLECLASVYPGYEYTGTAGSVVVVTLYGVLDGAVAGLLLGAIYNACTPRPKPRTDDTPTAA